MIIYSDDVSHIMHQQKIIVHLYYIIQVVCYNK